MKEIIKQSTDLFYEIDDCTTKLLKARLDKDTNKEHESLCKMESLLVGTMQHISWLVCELKGRSQIKWQTGEPKEEGFYLVTFRFLNNHEKNGITKAEWYNKHWYIGLNYPQEEILAWCKLSDIEPYKEETK